LGLPMSDRFITTFNPKQLQSRPRVYDVDGPSFRRTNT